MSYYLPDGGRLYMSTTFAAEKTISAVTNANAAVATSTTHGYSDNDELLFVSGWEDATDTVWRANQLTADTFELVGLDATDTDIYPAGTGTGTTAKISGWTELQQWLESSPSGGDVRYVDVNPISRRNGIRIPAGFNPMSFDLEFGYDGALASQIAMIAASRTFTKAAFKLVAAGGLTGYFYGNISFSEMPTMQKGDVMRARAGVSVLGRFISYV